MVCDLCVTVMLVLKRDTYRLRTLKELTANSVANWEHGVLCLRDFYTWHRFKAEFSFDTTDPNAVLCRPVRPYENSAFERFFGFGGHCHDFTNQRVILVKDLNIHADLQYKKRDG